MHGGSGNHGCEAIVRTTASLLGGPRDVVLWSQSKEEDERYGASACVERIARSEEIERYSAAHFESLFRRKILRDRKANLHIFLRELFRDNVAVLIGGDNYCYPWSAKQAVEFNREIRKHCKKTVLWGCSIDSEAITPDVREDLAAYDLITAREQVTYQRLKEINPRTVQVADSAFLLDRIDCPLPEHFIEGNTVGINISPLIMQYGTERNLILQNYTELVRYIIDQTDMNVCLIPHVVWEYNNDLEPVRYLYDLYESTGRVCMIPDGNCMELKGYIARCRFFVGARTHATIAAYSSYVPTLVVGYSTKSIGIARDLFGTDEGYVCPVQRMKAASDLTEQFIGLYGQEAELKARLENAVPVQERKAREAVTCFPMM